MTISIKETNAFGQTIVAVLYNDKILSLRKGEVTEHEKQCARYHAKKARQGMIQIHRVDGPDSHLPTVERTHD